MVNPQNGVVGLIIQLTVKDQDGEAVDLSGATTKKILLQKPSGDVVSKDADFVSGGSDGKLKYVTVADDINEVGLWKTQAQIAITGFSGKTSKQSFTVEGNLGE